MHVAGVLGYDEEVGGDPPLKSPEGKLYEKLIVSIITWFQFDACITGTDCVHLLLSRASSE
jgi:hypothetical protein